MVGIVLVSHSRALALAVQELVRSMTGPALPLAIAAGAGDKHAELGTDAVEISEAITSVHGPEGVLVLMDMGSAILSSDMALELLDESLRASVTFCAAPFVEGAVAAGVTANLGAPLPEVLREALASLKQKETALAPPGDKPAPDQSSPAPTSDASGKEWRHLRLKIPNAHGLHARPAARLINDTRPFQSELTIRNLSNQRGPVSLKSLSSVASLEILHDNEIEIAASGEDASAALARIEDLIQSGLGDDLSSKATHVAPPPSPDKSSATTTGPLPVSDGIAIGTAVLLKNAHLEIPQEKTTDIKAEVRRLQTALTSAEEALEIRRDQMSLSTGDSHAGIYGAQILALQDPELMGQAIKTIEAEQANAALAWDRATQRIANRYRALQDPYLRERAADLEDVGRQVLERLIDHKPEVPALTEPSILIADDFTPYQVSTLSREHVRGVILLDGGPTAHSSILLKALGIPTVIQARNALIDVPLESLKTIAFDGSTGSIWPHPEPDFLAKLQDRQKAQLRRQNEEQKASAIPGATRDGTRCEIMANIGHATEAETALQAGAEGIGLLRTEFLFLDRTSAPTEEEQMQALGDIAQKMAGKPVIVRTLDAGGDKALPYLHMPHEENPFLGVRAVRLCFSHEEIFTTQLRAILRAGHGHDFRIMFPMIANLSDLTRATAYLDKVHRELEAAHIPHLWPIQKGIMIEIPSAALQAETLAEQADFFSIGTNDLTQYTLAADRGNPALASYQDALHPSVLRLIEKVVTGASKHNRPVAVCGEAASDELSAAIFLGLGIRELSMSASKIPRIKAALRQQNLTDLQKAAEQALSCQTAEEVRTLSPDGKKSH